MSAKHDIQDMLDKQVIDQQTAERIREYYESKALNFEATTIISAVAACLVGMGIISIIAYNWDALPTSIRVLLSFVPLIASSLLCFYVLKKKSEKRPWTESAAILQALCFSASYAMINQIYQIQGDISTFVCIVALASLPLVFLLRSTGLSLLILLLSAIFTCRKGFVFYTTLIIVVADIIFLYLYYFKWKEDFLVRLRVALLPFTVAYFSYNLIDHIFPLNDNSIALYFCVVASLFFVTHQFINQSTQIPSRGLSLKLGFYFTFFLGIVIYAFDNNIHWEYYTNSLMNFLKAISIIGLPLVGALIYKATKKITPQWQEWIGLAYALFAVISGELLSIIAIAIIIYAIHESCQKYDLIEMNTAIVALFAWTFSLNMPYFLNGIILILLGVALILMNRYLISKKKAHELESNK